MLNKTELWQGNATNVTKFLRKEYKYSLSFRFSSFKIWSCKEKKASLFGFHTTKSFDRKEKWLGPCCCLSLERWASISARRKGAASPCPLDQIVVVIWISRLWWKMSSRSFSHSWSVSLLRASLAGAHGPLGFHQDTSWGCHPQLGRLFRTLPVALEYRLLVHADGPHSTSFWELVCC